MGVGAQNRGERYPTRQNSNMFVPAFKTDEHALVVCKAETNAFRWLELIAF